MTRTRVGFLGTGWIGRSRLEAIVATDAVEVVAIVEPDDDCAEEALKLAPEVRRLPSHEAMLAERLDGVVIATPSALHASQSIAALESGAAVFCQKPLGRNADEVRAVVEAARRADRLLGVDLSYRHTAAAQAITGALQAGQLGEVFAVDLTFHNAYGPDKSWFYDRQLSGGGCVVDLGVHLVDLALWLLDFPQVERVQSSLFAEGRRLHAGSEAVEDYATATLDLATGTAVRLACSWHLNAGQDAVFEAAFHGSEASAVLRNVDGSFYDFEAQLNKGTASEIVARPPDSWSGRAAAAWARKLAESNGFDEVATHNERVAEVLDLIYFGG